MEYLEAQSMLSMDELNKLIQTRFSYKPGFEFQVYRNPYEGLYLSIKVTLPDAYNPGETTDLRINSPIPNIARSYAYFFEWLLERVIKVEVHEVCEFFRVDGIPYYNPHVPIEPPDERVKAPSR